MEKDSIKNNNGIALEDKNEELKCYLRGITGGIITNPFNTFQQLYSNESIIIDEPILESPFGIDTEEALKELGYEVNIVKDREGSFYCHIIYASNKKELKKATDYFIGNDFEKYIILNNLKYRIDITKQKIDFLNENYKLIRRYYTDSGQLDNAERIAREIALEDENIAFAITKLRGDAAEIDISEIRNTKTKRQRGVKEEELQIELIEVDVKRKKHRLKKVLFIPFVLSLFLSNAYACLCLSFIQGAFSLTGQAIKASLEAQKSSLDTLEETIKKTKENVKKQNQTLEINNKMLKDEIIRDKELIFYLNQKNNLK